MNRRALVFTAPAAVLVACGPQQSQPASQTPGAQQPQQQAGKPVRGGTLTIVMSRDATNFDPIRQNDAFSSSVMNSVIDTLYEIDAKGSVVGRLVEKTENPQPNVYVWSIRKGITFQDGTPLNAEAVKFNLQRHVENTASVRHQDVKDITAMDVTDPYTLKVTLRAPFGPFASKLTGGAGFILSPTAIQKLGEGIQRDLTGAGSGAFKFTAWQKDTAITLEKSATYWKKDTDGSALPYLDKVVFKPFPDENVRLTNVKTGDADLMLANPPFKDVADLRRDSTLNVSEIPGIGFNIVMMNTTTEPFNDVRVRRAFSYAIDRAVIRKNVYFDNGKQLDTPVPESITWAHGGAGPYARRDVAKAKAEMQSAGKTSAKFTFQISNASPELQQIAELIKDQIKEVGLEMEIQLLEFATVVANGGDGKFQSIGLGWTGDIDPDTLYSLYRSGAGFNYPKYANPQVDKLLDDARATPEQAKRGDLYKQVQKILWDEQPYLVYFNSPQILVTRKTVQNYQNTYNGYWATRNLDQVWKNR